MPIFDKDGKPTNLGRDDKPQVPPEVEQWGHLVSWLRAKDYTPTMVRATILDYEQKQKEEECTGLDSTLKQQD